MEARAELKFIRISPRKVGIVLDLIRNKKCDEALAVLRHTPKSASEPLRKLLTSAMANAENNHSMDLSECYVSECHCGPGVTMKRIRAKDHGRAHRIFKRTSNVVLVVKEAEEAN
ncbi:MAG: 50S ribosomal protein L22 [Oscillospiraceae bacterium]|jgi:large subunit ribosomal protein L22|nr:50S ribosomal protein L22 [Oscillospiraceae bacterium]